ncbi:hypothetical protein C8Q70DRAFT_970702, partial [Cubamyces menziesii]
LACFGLAFLSLKVPGLTCIRSPIPPETGINRACALCRGLRYGHSYRGPPSIQYVAEVFRAHKRQRATRKTARVYIHTC